MEEWLDKEHLTHRQEYHSEHKKNEILSSATTWKTNPEGIVLNEIGKAEKDKYSMISLIRKLKYHSLAPQKSQVHRYRE